MKRRDFIKATTGVVGVSSLTGSGAMWAEEPRARMNLLFLTVDDMNWSLPGFMGNTLGLTPNLDVPDVLLEPGII